MAFKESLKHIYTHHILTHMCQLNIFPTSNPTISPLNFQNNINSSSSINICECYIRFVRVLYAKAPSRKHLQFIKRKDYILSISIVCVVSCGLINFRTMYIYVQHNIYMQNAINSVNTLSDD